MVQPNSNPPIPGLKYLKATKAISKSLVNVDHSNEKLNYMTVRVLKYGNTEL